MLRRRELTSEGKVKILMQILDALEHAHNEDVVHRDIKPSNVYRLLDGSVKLVDFGLARMMRAETLTLSGAVMGTPHYASPEQLKGETSTSGRTSIRSARSPSKCSPGRRPFQTDYDSVATIVLKVISEPPPPMDVRSAARSPRSSASCKAMSKRRTTAIRPRPRCATSSRRSSRAHVTPSAPSRSTEHRRARQTLEEARGLLDTGKRKKRRRC